MAEEDRRQHVRTAMNARVKIVHQSFGEFFFNTSDISDGGLFIVMEDDTFRPELGDRVTVQVQGLPVPAPVLEMCVVRKTNDGLGLQFENC
ncbi:MAG: type IV pilus assembly PilZ [Marinobacter sp. T13-3]|nr:MAG: type IV pilus assembly PilZ [Marinobacter sp. T13-3]